MSKSPKSLRKRVLPPLLVTAGLIGTALPGHAFENLHFDMRGGDDALRETVGSVSLLMTARNDRVTDTQEVMAAAQSDYARILGALYAEAYYGAVIHILIDGREAANVPALEPPASIRQIVIQITPGPRFNFGTASIAPLARGTELPTGFRTGSTALSPLIQESLDPAVQAWREAGHAKVDIASQQVTADHRSDRLNVDVRLDPGPRVRFGNVTVTGNQTVRTDRIIAIAGLPEGEVYSPDEMDEAGKRLRRAGPFASVALEESDVRAGDIMDINVAIAESLPRRFGFGAELASEDGASLTGFWLHRNLFGGAENLRIDGEITGIGGTTQNGGTDYSLGGVLSRPATFNADTDLTVTTLFERKDDHDYRTTNAIFGLGVKHYFNDHLTGRASVNYGRYYVQEEGDSRTFEIYSVIGGGTWDRRDDPLNATRGFYLDAEAQPFMGAGSTGSGARFTADGRVFFSPGERDRFVLAARAQLGAVVGPELQDTPRDFLFYSGGSGTVRGQPYQELGVSNPNYPDNTIGGKTFVGLSGELRTGITKTIGLVAFYDAGYVGAEGFFDDSGSWHSGAGLGIRYNTGIGPIRFDVAMPVEGDNGHGVQLYIGIGQAF